MRRVLAFTTLLAAAALSAGCGQGATGGTSRAEQHPQTLRLTPGRYVFHLGARVRVGDTIACVTKAGRPAGGGGVEPRGHGVGSSTGFEAMTFPSGTVRVTCPAHPGNT